MVRPFAVIGFTVFFTIAILFEFEAGVTVIALAAFTVALVISLFVRNARRQRVLPCAFGSGAVACAVLLSAINFSYMPAVAYDGRVCQVIAELTSSPRIEYGNYYYDARAVSVDGEDVDLKLRLSFSSPPDAEPYDMVEGSFNLYLLGSSSEEFLLSHKANGVFLGAYPTTGECGVIHVPEAEKPFAKTIFDIREAIKNAVYRVLPNEAGALAVALLIGDKSGLSAETLADFQAIGITHIICVSGYHLSLWSMLILKILRKTRMNERLASVFAAIGVVAFMLIAGLTYSVIRSGIMMLVYLLGNIIFKRRDSINSLGFALAVIALYNPFAMGDAGLQLSALATLGLLLYSQYSAPDVNKFLNKIKYKNLALLVKKLVSALMVTASATAFTLPVSLQMYGGFNFIVFAANLIAVPVAGLCMVLCAAGALFGSFLPAVFNPFGFWGGFSAQFLTGFAETLSDIDFLVFRTDSDQSAVILCGLLLICLIAVILTYSGKSVRRITCILCAAFFTFSVVFFSASRRGETRLNVIDCGNGTAVLVTVGGENILIGCGGTEFLGAMKICEAVDSVGGGLDAIIISDSSEYSSGYLNQVLASYTPAEIYFSELPDGSNLLLKNSKKYDFTDLNHGEKISLKSLKINNNYCVLFKNEDISALICFDSVFDYSSLSKEFRGADVVISRSDYPSGAERSDCSAVIINAENNRGILIQQELLNKGINCVATGGCGNILIRAKDGEISANRE